MQAHPVAAALTHSSATMATNDQPGSRAINATRVVVALEGNKTLITGALDLLRASGVRVTECDNFTSEAPPPPTDSDVAVPGADAAAACPASAPPEARVTDTLCPYCVFLPAVPVDAKCGFGVTTLSNHIAKHRLDCQLSDFIGRHEETGPNHDPTFTLRAPTTCRAAPGHRISRPTKQAATNHFVASMMRLHLTAPRSYYNLEKWAAQAPAPDWAWTINPAVTPLTTINPIRAVTRLTQLPPPQRPNAPPPPTWMGMWHGIACGPLTLLSALAASPSHATLGAEQLAKSCSNLMEAVNRTAMHLNAHIDMDLRSGTTIETMIWASDIAAESGVFFNVAILGIQTVIMGAGNHTLQLAPVRSWPGCSIWAVYYPPVNNDRAHWELLHLPDREYTTDFQNLGAAAPVAPPRNLTPVGALDYTRASNGLLVATVILADVNAITLNNMGWQNGMAFPSWEWMALTQLLDPEMFSVARPHQRRQAQLAALELDAERVKMAQELDEMYERAMVDMQRQAGTLALQPYEAQRLAEKNRQLHSKLLAGLGMTTDDAPAGLDLMQTIDWADGHKRQMIDADYQEELDGLYNDFMETAIKLIISQSRLTTSPQGHILGPRRRPYLKHWATPTDVGMAHNVTVYCTHTRGHHDLIVTTALLGRFRTLHPGEHDTARALYAVDHHKRDEARGDNYYVVGAHPPPLKCSHWCGAGSAAADDPSIVAVLEAQGITVCNCTWLFRGRCVHYIRTYLNHWGDVRSFGTSVSERAHAMDYLLPVRRSGWTPFAETHGAHGVSYGLQGGNALRPSATTPSHRIVTCDGPFPCTSQRHRLAPRTVMNPDPLTASLVDDNNGPRTESYQSVECLFYTCELNWRQASRVGYERTLAIILLTLTLLLSFACMLAMVHSQSWIDAAIRNNDWEDCGIRPYPVNRTNWEPPTIKPFNTTHHWVAAADQAILLFIHRVLAFTYSAAAATWDFTIWFGLQTALIYTTCVTHDVPIVAYNALWWVACVLSPAFPVTIFLLVSYHLASDFVDTWLRRPPPWIPHQSRWMAPYIYSAMLVPELQKTVCAALAQWDGVTPFRTTLQSKIVRELFLSGWGNVEKPGDHTGYADQDLVECLARCISGPSTLTRAGYRCTSSAADGIWRIRKLMDNLAGMHKRVIASDRERLQCVRPGCKRMIGPGRSSAHLCRTCSESRTVTCNAAEAWLSGQRLPLLPDRYLAIPERELPLPPTDVDTEGGIIITADKEDKIAFQFDEAAITKPAGFLAGFGIATAPPMATLKSYVANMRAILARVFKRNPVKPDIELWDVIERAAYGPGQPLSNFDGHMEIQPLSLPDWLASFIPSRADVLRRTEVAWAAISHSWEFISWKSTRAFGLFTKREWLPSYETATDPRAERSRRWTREEDLLFVKMAAKPRAIQAPEDCTHLATGPFLRALTHKLKHDWGPSSHIFYASTTPDELDAWLNHLVAHSEAFIWCDYTMFDCTHSRRTWALLETLYAKLLPKDWEHYELFWRIMENWRAPWGHARGKRSYNHNVSARYKGRIMNASGRDDTALANAVLNGLAMSWAIACALWDCDPIALTQEMWLAAQEVVRLAIVGDDSIAGIPMKDLNGNPIDLPAFSTRVEATIRRLGFIPKLGHSLRWQDIVFLGCRPYKVSGRYMWGPTLGRRLYKHHACIHPDRNPVAWLNGVADMELRCYNHVPVLRTMAARVLQLQAGLKVTPYKWDPHQICWERPAKTPDPDLETYIGLAEAYTTPTTLVTVEAILDLERSIMTVDSLPAVLAHPCLDAFLLVDEA